MRKVAWKANWHLTPGLYKDQVTEKLIKVKKARSGCGNEPAHVYCGCLLFHNLRLLAGCANLITVIVIRVIARHMLRHSEGRSWIVCRFL